jgi:hypothetical protein
VIREANRAIQSCHSKSIYVARRISRGALVPNARRNHARAGASISE